MPVNQQALLNMWVDHEKRFTSLEESIIAFKDSILSTLDGMVVILHRLDQERVFTSERISRIEARLDKVEERLDRIEARLDSHENRLKKLEKNQASLQKNVREIKHILLTRLPAL